MTDTKKDLVEPLTAAGLATVPPLVAGDPASAALAGFMTLLPPVVSLVIPPIFERKKKEVREWWDKVVMYNGTDIGAAAEIKARIDDANVQEVIMAALRSILEAISPTTIPALAMLTREYARQGKPRDDFFRGTAEMLADLSVGEYAEFREVIRWIARSADGAVVLTVQRVDGPLDTVAMPDVREHLSVFRWRQDLQTLVTPTDFPLRYTRRLFKLLKRSGLASEAPTGPGGAPSGPDVLYCETATMAHLGTLLV